MIFQLTSATNIEWLADYSTKSFLKGLSAHFHRYRVARIVASDRGSQIQALAWVTWSQSHSAAAELAQASGGESTVQNPGEKQVTWEEIVKEAKRHFSGTQSSWPR